MWEEVILKEPIILESDDWTPEEWTVVCKIFAINTNDIVKVKPNGISIFNSLK